MAGVSHQFAHLDIKLILLLNQSFFLQKCRVNGESFKALVLEHGSSKFSNKFYIHVHATNFIHTKRTSSILANLKSLC